MRTILLTNWHFMRFIRLAIGIILLVQAFTAHDYVPGAIALFFLYQAIANAGCGGSGACIVPSNNAADNKLGKDQTIEE